MDESDGQIVNFERICRLCLHEKRTLTDIFEPTADNNNFSIDQKIMACATIDLSKGDGLPSRICVKCLSSVNAAFDFRVQCENADKTLHILHNLINSETDKEAKSDKGITPVEAIVEEEVEQETDRDETEKRETKWNLDNGKLSEERSENNILTVDLTDSRKELLPTVQELSETSLTLKKTGGGGGERGRVPSGDGGGGGRGPRPRRKDVQVHRCEPCGKTFNSRKSLVRHNLNSHGTGTEKQKKTHECSICTEIFTRWTDLYEHQKSLSHHEKEKCEHCEKYFSRSYMVEHLRNHTGEKPYLCNLCGRSFGQVSSFYKHKKLCSNAEKKLKCSFCDRRYYERYTLMEHERIHTNEKPFICETCGKAFRRKGKLHIHQLSHTDVKPHTCNVCNRSFRQRGHLTEHMRIHSGVKPFTCDVCGAAFTQGHSLKTHKMKHPEMKMI